MTERADSKTETLQERWKTGQLIWPVGTDCYEGEVGVVYSAVLHCAYAYRLDICNYRNRCYNITEIRPCRIFYLTSYTQNWRKWFNIFNINYPLEGAC